MKGNTINKEIITLALLIGILPPLWAVASPYIGVSVGPIALICAGIYATNGNKFEDAHKIALGYLAGDSWSLIATFAMVNNHTLNPDILLFLLLFVLGFLVVVISSMIPNIIHMPSWLAGWAIAMLTMNLDTTTGLPNLAVQIGVAMLVGVYYVGALLDKIHRVINGR
ncbi:MAG: DUF1097 domain-containing protein [Firmicutes bacterium]|nr:DUF1097 domain-containing protein [Bacillota bacterium]